MEKQSLNAPIKTHRVAYWIKKKKERKKERKKKQESTICCLQEIHFGAKDTHRLKVTEWKQMFQTEMT